MRARVVAIALKIGAALAVALAPAALAEVPSPITAKSFFSASGFAKGEQRRLAERILDDKWLRDLEAEEYLRRMTRAMLPDDEHFVIVADIDEVNAFAYLGGIVVIYRGLWNFAQDQHGLAGVVAHELAHVKLDHVRMSRDNAERASSIATPILIAGLLIDDPEVREAVVAGSAGLLTGDIIAYSRELEHEADVHAVETLWGTRYDPRGMARIFSRFGGSSNEYLSTHPASDRRGAYLADRLHDAPAPSGMPDLDFYLLQEKMRRGDVVERAYQQKQRATLASDTASAAQKLLARYGLLLSATKTRNAALGEEMTAALEQVNNPLIARAMAENLRQRGQAEQALRVLDAAMAAHAGRSALALERFKTLERLKRHEEALAMFAELPRELREEPQLLLAAGRAAALAGERFLSNFYLANGHVQNGHFEQAQRQIAIAEKFRGKDTKTIVALEELKKGVQRELKLLRERRVLDEE